MKRKHKIRCGKKLKKWRRGKLYPENKFAVIIKDDNREDLFFTCDDINKAKFICSIFLYKYIDKNSHFWKLSIESIK